MLRLRSILAFMLTIIAISFLELNLWIWMVLIWFGIGIFIVKKEIYKNLNPVELKAWIFILYGYPLLEAIIKIFIYRNIIPYSYLSLNIMEHSLWAFAMTIYLFPLFKVKEKPGYLVSYIALFAVVIFIGNLNEFLEMAIRVYIGLTDEYHFALYYSDTMRDLAMNILGASLGMGLLKILKYKPNNTSKVLSF